MLATTRGGAVLDERAEDATDLLEWIREQKAAGRMLHRISVEEAEVARVEKRHRPAKGRRA